MAALAGVISSTASVGEREALGRRMARRSAATLDALEHDGIASFCRGQRLVHAGSLVMALDGFVLDSRQVVRRQARDHLCEATGFLHELTCLLAVEPDAARDLDGAFSIVICDLAERRVTLIRDRLGGRPLLYTEARGGWVWASDVHTLMPFVQDTRVDPVALDQAVNYRMLVGDRKLIAGVRQVPPAHFMVLQADTAPSLRRYWSFRPAPEYGVGQDTWVKRTDEALDRAFRDLATRFSHAAVTLSGGVDSTLMLAKARDHFPKVSAYALVIEGWDNPELQRAQQAASDLGVDLIEVPFGERHLPEAFAQLIRCMEEPPRQWNAPALLHLYSTIGRDASVDALISGEVADTLFGSGDALRYITFARYQQLLGGLPSPLRRLAMSLATPLGRVFGRARAELVAELLRYSCDDELQRLLSIRYRTPPSTLLSGLSGACTSDAGLMARIREDVDDHPSRVQQYCLFTSIVNQLERMDRYAALSGYEVVCPFAALPMLELASHVPHEARFSKGVLKPILKELASRYVSRELMHAPKLGFPVPLPDWLRGGLAPLVRDVADSTPARRIYKPGGMAAALASGDAELTWTAIGIEYALREILEEPARLQSHANG